MYIRTWRLCGDRGDGRYVVMWRLCDDRDDGRYLGT